MKIALNELLLHLTEANRIFRSTDFDFDGRSDDIGFGVANITIFQEENMPQNKFYGKNYFFSETRNIFPCYFSKPIILIYNELNFCYFF